MLIWHVYWPGNSFASGTWNCSGSVARLFFASSLSRTEGDSKAFLSPRKNETLAETLTALVSASVPVS